ARADVEKFPDLINRVLSILRDRMPETILATFAFYGSQASILSTGETRSLSKDILQHHIELLQGIVLTIPAEEWGHAPSTADIMQTVFDIVPKVTDTFFKRRLINQVDEADE